MWMFLVSFLVVIVLLFSWKWNDVLLIVMCLVGLFCSVLGDSLCVIVLLFFCSFCSKLGLIVSRLQLVSLMIWLVVWKFVFIILVLQLKVLQYVQMWCIDCMFGLFVLLFCVLFQLVLVCFLYQLQMWLMNGEISCVLVFVYVVVCMSEKSRVMLYLIFFFCSILVVWMFFYVDVSLIRMCLWLMLVVLYSLMSL